MGAMRLFTRLKAFRDEHIKIEIVPILYGIADIITELKEANINRIATTMNLAGQQMRVIALYGSIFTRYDRKMMSELEEITDFEQLQRQSFKIKTRMNELKPILEEKMRKFKPMKNMYITDPHQVSYHR